MVVKHFEESSRQRVKGIGGSGTEPDRDGGLVCNQGVAKRPIDWDCAWGRCAQVGKLRWVRILVINARSSIAARYCQVDPIYGVPSIITR